MQYADIQSLFYQMTKTNSTDVPGATLNLYTQQAEDEAAALVLSNDSTWQFDDNNYTDRPIATADLVSGQQSYTLAVSQFSIDRVEVEDASNIWHALTQLDQQQFKDNKLQALEQLFPTSGMPTDYDVMGSSVDLYATPNFSKTAALKLFFTRGPLRFDFSTGKFTDGTGSTSSVPGFNSLFHRIIPLYAARNWGVANTLPNATLILQDILRTEAKVEKFFGLRNRDRRRRMTISTNGTQGNQSGIINRGGGDSNE